MICRDNWKLHASLRDMRDRKPTAVSLVRGQGATRIDDEGAGLLAAALAKCSTVSKVDLQGNAIGDDGAAALARVVQRSDTLVELNLSWNNIGDRGAAALADAVKPNVRLKVLQLFGNPRVGLQGISALTAAMSLNRTLRTLTLDFTRAGEEAARNFKAVFGLRARALPLLDALGALRGPHPPLELDLGGQMVGGAGAGALAKALLYNRTVAEVNLCSCSVDDAGARKLADMLNTNKTIKLMRLHNNKMSDGAKEELAEAWAGRILL